MSAPNEHYPSTVISDDGLFRQLKGENPRSSPKKNGERHKNGEDGPVNSSASPRSSGRNISTGMQSGSRERFEPSSTAEMKAKPQGTERSTSVLQAELISTIVGACVTADELETSKIECKRLREQNTEILKKLEEAKRDLDEAQEFVFSLQRREQKLTESDAAKEFSSLCMSVENWVQTRLGDAIEKKIARQGGEIFGPSARKLLSLIPQPGQEAFQYPDSDEYNVIAAIMKFLYIEIFDKEFYCPIDQGAMELLISIERSMRNRRDLVTWRSWRSETFTAITKRHEFDKQRQLCSAKLSSDLASMLALFLPRSDIRKLSVAVQSTIIEPALQLAHKMHLSVNEFSMVYTNWHGTKKGKRVPLPRDKSPFECVTISPPWKVLKFPVPEGRVTYLLDLSPELVFKAVKTNSFAESRVLKRAKVLVAVTEDRETMYDAASLPPRELPTLLGWMHEIISPRQTLTGKLFRK